MKYFFDTNILLHENKQFFQSLSQKFYISTVTLEELENIKTALNKDNEIKYKARKMAHWLIQNQDKYIPILYNQKFKNYIFTNLNSNDEKIIATASYISNTKEKIIFETADLNCFLIAKANKLQCKLINLYKKKEKYDGYIKIYCNSDEELADFYNNYLYTDKIKDFIINNQYILVYNKNKEVIDKYRYLNSQIIQVPFTAAKSKMFGNVKPIDPYQELAMDSFKNNKRTSWHREISSFSGFFI